MKNLMLEDQIISADEVNIKNYKEEDVYDMYEAAEDYGTIMNRTRWSEEPKLKNLYTATERMIAGEAVLVPGTWLKYYYTKYAIYQPNRISFSIGKNGEVAITDCETITERKNTVNYILDTFGTEQIIDPVVGTKNAGKRIKRLMKYDPSYKDSDVVTCITDGRGFCVQYAIIAKILLNAEGIPTRTVYGTLNGTEHMWNECYINGKWVTVDLSKSDEYVKEI